ncbi:hypothetical protein BHM03_00028491 [Ensete ventricosum]|nr:hypothetical protein BHM03_00028491 [Ensete ventricosum]
MIGAIGELDYFSAYIRLRESEKSEEKAEGVEAVVERSEEVTMSPEGLSYPKGKASVRREVDSDECHNATEADLPIMKKGTQIQGNR